MRRRALLASLAAGTAGLAGCSFAGGDTAEESTTTDDHTPTGTPSPTGTPRPDGRRSWPEPPDQQASVVDAETMARTYAFYPVRLHTDDEARVALWFDRTATDEHPARLTGWLENANDFENTFQIEWIPPVGRTASRQPRGYDHEARLHVVPTEANGLTAGSPDLARTESGIWYARDGGPEVPDTYRMEAGERVALEYHLVGERGATERPTGIYEFRGRDERARVTVWNTAHPGPEESSRFGGRSLPPLGEERSVQWYHDADARTKAFVRPSAERVDVDGLVGFEMVNNSSETVGCGHWNLHKLVDGEWFRVAPAGHTSDCRNLPPGGRTEWSLRAFNGESVPCGDGCGGGLTRGYLGDGEYAVVAGYGHPTDASAALVELVGDPVTVVQTDDAVRERDGDTVTVTTDRYGDGDDPPDAALTLTRTDSAGERLIAEQVMGQGWLAADGRGLRNVLSALTDGVERVVLRTDDRVADAALGFDSHPRRFRFRGQAYELRRGGDGVDQ
jgi:hypothetical protein